MRVSTHRRSDAGKLGGLPATYSDSSTCPDACPLKYASEASRIAGDPDGACFARKGLHTNHHWTKVDSGERGGSFAELLTFVRKLPAGEPWRHDVAGDLPGKGNRIAPRKLAQLAEAASHTRGFTYTHKPDTAANIRAIRAANAAGFTVNLSANNPAHADKLARHGLPIATMIPKDAPRFTRTPDGTAIVGCPAAFDPDVSCSTCGGAAGPICSLQDRSFYVGFPAHGPAKNRADAIAREGGLRARDGGWIHA